MPKMIFVNLPVADLAASTRFYEAIGCRKNEQFSDEKASSMIWSDTITFQLLVRDYFATFTSKPVADAHATCQALLCLSRDSRGDVDLLAESAANAGGTADMRAAIDMDFLYNRAFEDDCLTTQPAGGFVPWRRGVGGVRRPHRAAPLSNPHQAEETIMPAVITMAKTAYAPMIREFSREP